MLKLVCFDLFPIFKVYPCYSWNIPLPFLGIFPFMLSLAYTYIFLSLFPQYNYSLLSNSNRAILYFSSLRIQPFYFIEHLILSDMAHLSLYSNHISFFSTPLMECYLPLKDSQCSLSSLKKIHPYAYYVILPFYIFFCAFLIESIFIFGTPSMLLISFIDQFFLDNANMYNLFLHHTLYILVNLLLTSLLV